MRRIGRHSSLLLRVTGASALCLFLAACPFDDNENSCVSLEKSWKPRASELLRNSCSYAINVRYCRVSRTERNRNPTPRCAFREAGAGETIVKFFNPEQYHVKYAACRAPERPQVTGNGFTCVAQGE